MENYITELELKKLRQLMASIELKRAELEQAKDILSSSKWRTIFRSFPGLMIEITKEEAIDYIEKAIAGYERELSKLRKREKELLKKLSII